jgi:hypothetical protein
VEKIEADRLLDLHRAALQTVLPDILDAHVAAAPEIVKVALLRGQQLLEALGRYAIQSPLSKTADFLGRGHSGGMIDDVFGELDRRSRARVDSEGNLAEVVAVDGFIGMRAGGLQRMVGGTRHGQTALFRRMAQHDAPAVRITGSRMENPTGKGFG